MIKRIELFDKNTGRCEEVEQKIDLSSVRKVVIKYDDGSYETFIPQEHTATSAPAEAAKEEYFGRCSNRIRYMLMVIESIEADQSSEDIKTKYNNAVRALGKQVPAGESTIRAKFIRSVPDDDGINCENKTEYWLRLIAGSDRDALKDALLASCTGSRTKDYDKSAIIRFFSSRI